MDFLNKEQEFHLKDYLELIRKRLGLIILFFITTVTVVTVGSFTMKPVYQATVTLLIDLESPNVLTSTGAIALEAQNYYSYKEYYQSQKEILTSLSIVNKVFDEFDLRHSVDYEKEKDPVRKFLKTIKVESVRDTRLLELNVENKDPKLAATIANRIANIYVQRNLYYISRDEWMNLLKNEYLKLEAKLSEYNKVYKDKHPNMVRLKKEYYDMAQRIEQARKSTFEDDFFDKIESTPSYKYELEGFKANNVSIQDLAEVPIKPIRPKKKLNIALSIMVGLFGGVGLALFFEYLDDTVKSVEDVAKLTDWPFLGNIPDIDKSSGRMKEFEKDILLHKKPKDPVSEAIRSIRTSILFSSTEEHPLKTLIVTSPGPQEGKTTALCNLAIAMAQNNKDVLIVDADMRKPRLHGVFKTSNDVGLSNFLSLQAGFKDIIQATTIENLFMVSGGLYPPDPSELLSSHKMEEFIKLAKEKFDFVLFDSPPIAAVTDAVILSHLTDGLIMIIESGKTSRKAIPQINQLLKNTKTRILGIIINKISTKGRHYYYYAKYYGK